MTCFGSFNARVAEISIEQGEVHIVASNEVPSGIGENATPAIAPSVTNATGTRIRKLPISLALAT